MSPYPNDDRDAELIRNLEHDVDLLVALGELEHPKADQGDEPPLTDTQLHVLRELYRNARLGSFPEKELARRLGMDESEIHRTLMELADLGLIDWAPAGGGEP